jgi:hypothetical protein
VIAYWVFFVILVVFGCGLIWFIAGENFWPMPLRRKQDDPFAGAKQMAVNRAEYTRINREAMAAWEDACDCRPEPPSERLMGPNEYLYHLMKEAGQMAKRDLEYGLTPARVVYEGDYAAPPYTGPLYSNPHSPFNDYLRQQYMPKYVPTPGSVPPMESTPPDYRAQQRRPNPRVAR